MTNVNSSTWIDWMLTDKRVPLNLRVTVAAYRFADESETLFLDAGDLARLVGAEDRRVLGKAVARAVEQGFLAEPSGTTALRLAPMGKTA